ncbi:hypothetical protein [Prevotella sp. KH2C16]|uniref:hypothetical protein n=1 Tax=Prevotella sp. KH2C16 TaxID=1855325 RepID=UPI0008E62E78|nr:hypothetical protein [Prevotella sp. KH2C16]SFG30995.1 hypothetical protein SAMN05216383_10984 [Prevotella sp. KH2C16]
MKNLVSNSCTETLRDTRKNYQQPRIKAMSLDAVEALCDVSTVIPNPEIPGDGNLSKENEGGYGYHDYNVWED